MQPQENVEDQINKLPEEFKKLAVSLLGFTEGMKSCFISADACGEPLFKELRTMLVGDAKVYFHTVCPLTKEVMFDLHKFFNVLGVLDSVEKFKKSFNYILKETETIIKKLEVCHELHLETLTTAQHRGIIAQKLVETLGLRKKVEKEKAKVAEAQKEAAEQNAENASAPFWIWFIPYGLPIWSSVTGEKEKRDWQSEAQTLLQASIAAKTRAQLAATAANLMSSCVLPALESYVENIQDLIKTLIKIQTGVKEMNPNLTVSDDEAEEEHGLTVGIFLDSVNNNATTIKDGITNMMANYDICEATFKTFDGLQNVTDYVSNALEKETKVAPEPVSLWTRVKQILSDKEGLMKNIGDVLTFMNKLNKK